MACGKCKNKRCKCKDMDLQVLTPPCTPPCNQKFQCYETIDWNCVIVPIGVQLTDTPTPYVTDANISLSSLLQQQILLATNSNCIRKGNPSRATPWLYAHFNGSQILVQWQPVNNSDLLSGWSVQDYTINIFHVQTSSFVTYTVSPTQNSFLISPTGSMSFAPGNTYQIFLTTKTQNGSSTASCQSVTLVITT